MKDFKIGDKFKKGFATYIMCRVEGYYYLININSGSKWTDGLEAHEMISELEKEGFEKIK